MAKGDKNDGLFGGTEAANAQGRALSETTENMQKYSQSIIPTNTNMANFRDGASRTGEELQTLNSKLKQGWESLKKYGDETFGAASALRDMRNAATGAVDQMNKLISVSAHWERRIKAVREGQELYSKSMLYHTGMQEKASKGLDKAINLVWGQYKIAKETMKEFNISSKEAIEIQQAARKQFIVQIQSYKDNSQAMKDLVKDTVILTRRLGMDAPQALKYMNTRMERTNMTMKQAQNETMLVAAAFDEYVKELKKTPGALQKANVTAQDWVHTMQQAGEAFKFGAFNAGAFATAIVPLQKAGREAGLSATEINDMNRGLIQLLDTAQDTQLKNIFGVQSAQDLLANLDQFIEKGDDAVKKRLSYVKKGLEEGGTQIQALKEVIQAAKGSPQLMAMIVNKMQGVDRRVMYEMTQQVANLGKNPMGARLLVDNLAAGSPFQKRMQEFADNSQAAKDATDKYREDAKAAAAKALTPQEKSWKAVLEIQQWLLKTELWLKQSLAATLAKVAVQAVLLVGKSVLQYYQLKRIERAIQVAGVGGGGGPLPGGSRVGRGGRIARGVGGALAIAGVVATVADVITSAKAAEKAETNKKLKPAAMRGGAVKGLWEGAATTATFGLYQVAKAYGAEKGIGSFLTGFWNKREKAMLGQDKSLGNIFKVAFATEEERAEMVKQQREAEETRLYGPKGPKMLDKERVRYAAMMAKLRKYAAGRLPLEQKITETEYKYLRARKRAADEYDRRARLEEKEKAEPHHFRLAKESLLESANKIGITRLQKVKDPKQRAGMLLREMLKTNELSDEGGASALKLLLTGGSKDPATAMMEGKINALLKTIGVSSEQMLNVMPSELQGARVRRFVAPRPDEGALGVSPLIKGDTEKYKNMVDQLIKTGMSEQAALTAVGIAASKKDSGKQQIIVSTETGEEINEPAKIDQTTNTMVVKTAGVNLVLRAADVTKLTDQYRSDFAASTNASKQ